MMSAHSQQGLNVNAPSNLADHRPHPWDPNRIGPDGVAAHLAKAFHLHVIQDVEHRRGMHRLQAAIAG